MPDVNGKSARDEPKSTRGQSALAAKYRLNDGRDILQVGFGVYRVPPGETCYRAVSEALAEGYRMIDTAKLYNNEEDVGRAVRDSGLPRDQVFVTTKVWDSDHGYQPALVAGRQSVERIGLGYVDLLLIHSPGQREGKIVETYDALLALQREGLVRSVGVSNFGVPHLEALTKAGRPLPVVNQIEMHPLIYNRPERRAVVDFCSRRGIFITAYGSVLSGQERKHRAQPLVAAARAHGKTPAQVLLRWALQKGFLVIPKSVHVERIRENAAIGDFMLSDSEMEALEGMRGDLGEYWDPLGWPVDVGDISHGS